MYEFWYDDVKPKYGENVKLCYMDTDRFIIHVKTKNIYKYIAEDVETRFDTSSYEIIRLLPKGKNRRVTGLIKYDLGGEIMKEFIGLWANPYSYLKDNNNEDKKAKGTKMWVMKRKIKSQDYKNCLEAAQFENKINHLQKNKIQVDSFKEDQKEFLKNNKLILKTQQRFKSERYNVFTEEIKKIPLSSNDDKNNSINCFDRNICIWS